MVRPGSKTRARICTLEDGETRWRSDDLATEEPLEIRLLAGGARRSIAVTMRTPGADFELAAGFLFSEGIVARRDDIWRITYCVDRELAIDQQYNIVNVELTSPMLPDLAALERHFMVSSACGVCGRASLAALQLRCPVPMPVTWQIAAEQLLTLPQQLAQQQQLFSTTGGLHAAALFDLAGNLVAVREDVGRHNALDKLIGWALLEQRLPLDQHILLVSGRASFELLQKSLAAGIQLVCAISAPSSLARDVAHSFGMTLVGFLRANRYNIYAGRERLRV